MNGPLDLARGLIRKAESDLTAARILAGMDQSADVVCFHSQQAVEK